MKGVILAGGMGSRLYPLTHATNKHLLPIYDKPMVYYPIQTLVSAGITEIMVVVGGSYAGHFMRVLKNGEEFGANIQYAYQEGEGGISAALSLAEDFADGEPITVILGDNTTDADITDSVRNFKSGAHVFLRRVPDPARFGVPRFETDPDGMPWIVEILEKPESPPSDFAVTGLYIYDAGVFDFIRQCEPSERGELEITDVNNFYVKNGTLTWSELDGYWLDAGTFDTLLAANYYWATKNNPEIKALLKKL